MQNSRGAHGIAHAKGSGAGRGIPTCCRGRKRRDWDPSSSPLALSPGHFPRCTGGRGSLRVLYSRSGVLLARGQGDVPLPWLVTADWKLGFSRGKKKKNLLLSMAHPQGLGFIPPVSSMDLNLPPSWNCASENEDAGMWCIRIPRISEDEMPGSC